MGSPFRLAGTVIRFLTLLRLKFCAYVLHEQAVHAESLLADHKRRYEITLLELRKIKARIAMLESPDVLLRQALKRPHLSKGQP